MNNFWYALASALAMSVISFTGVFLLLFKGFKLQQTFLVISAVVLLADSVFHLIPAALESASPFKVALLAGLGAALTVGVNKLTHSHEEPHQGLGYANLANEAVHNFIDGLALGVAWMAGVQSGLSASVAIAAHELPQEIGDFAILLSAGFSPTRLLKLNFMVSLTCTLGVLVSYWAGEGLSGNVRELLLPVTAGSFVAFGFYIMSPVLKAGGVTSIVAAASATLMIAILHHHEH